ncbi:MAG: hypothetical protein MZW92_03110 [Comamonadaceae bacterium]|nr:hypothetical protein [Comamonadaceae bacterium]
MKTNGGGHLRPAPRLVHLRPAGGRDGTGSRSRPSSAPTRASLRVYERDRPAGRAVNLYAAERTIGGDPAELGVFEMAQGRQRRST